MIAYCTKCRKKVALKNIKEIEIKKGVKEIVGECPFCGGKIYVRKTILK